MRSSTRMIGVLLLTIVGCASFSRPAGPISNPATIDNASYDLVWTIAVDVIEKYFDVAYENRYDGRIETRPVTGATLFEPWRHDTVDCQERLESTLQTIRRRGFFLIQPGPTGGFAITVEVYKELEDVAFPPGTFMTSGALIQSIEPTQEAVVTSPIRPPTGWISLGRDLKLEARIIDEIQRKVASCSGPAIE